MKKIVFVTMFCFVTLSCFAQEIKWANSYNGGKCNEDYTNRIVQSMYDSQGNLYICGTAGVNAMLGDTTIFSNSIPISIRRGTFVAKFDVNGNLLWKKSLAYASPDDIDDLYINMQLFNDSIVYMHSQVNGPKVNKPLFWFLDTLITYQNNPDTIPFYPTRRVNHEAFLKLSGQDGELLDAHYITHNEVHDPPYPATYLMSFLSSNFHVDRDGNYYIFIHTWYGDYRNYLELILDDRDTIQCAETDSHKYLSNVFIKLDSNFNFLWDKQVFLDEGPNGNISNINYISYDEDDNMYLSGVFRSSEYAWIDLGNNQRIKRSSPKADDTGFIIKYDTSCTPQWVNQFYIPKDIKYSLPYSYFRQSTIIGDTVFVSFKVRGAYSIQIDSGGWYYFDSLYTHPLDTANFMENWMHSGFVAYDKNTGQYLFHGLIKGTVNEFSSVAVNNGYIYNQVGHNDSWDIGSLDTTVISSPKVISLLKWNTNGEIVEIIDNYDINVPDSHGPEASRYTGPGSMSQNNNDPTEIFVSGGYLCDTLDLHDTIVTCPPLSYDGNVYMFVLKDSSVFNHYTIIHDTVCDSTDWRGQHITWKGDYYDTLQAADGYDSIIIYRVRIRHAFKDEQIVEINEGETYDFHGRILSTAGTYYDSLQTINGCDSVYVLNLSVQSGLEDVANNIVESINLAPNPVKDAATLTYTIKDNAHAIFVLYNSEGQELISKQLIGKGKQDISLNSYPAGTYFYRVYENERILKTDKLVIVR